VVVDDVETAVRFGLSAVGPVAEPRNAVDLDGSIVPPAAAATAAVGLIVNVKSAVTGVPATDRENGVTIAVYT